LLILAIILSFYEQHLDIPVKAKATIRGIQAVSSNGLLTQLGR